MKIILPVTVEPYRKTMDCGHDQTSIQNYNKKINGFKSTYELVYFLINSLLQIKSKIWSFCFFEEYENGKKCELYLINEDFNDFEDIIKVKIIDRDFLLDYQWKLIPYLRKLFYLKKTATCCFLDDVYIYSTRL